MNWINRIFNNKQEVNEQNHTTKIDYVQITIDWNADPVSPDVKLSVDGSDLLLTIFLNYYAFDNFKEGDKVKIIFQNCSEYSFNTCNDEGYYYSQYRTNPNELPWGEFYEIKSGLNRNFPKPITKLTSDSTSNRHFIFFFKDETFECLAENYKLIALTSKSVYL